MKLYHQYLLKSAFIPSKNRFIRDFFDRLFGQPHSLSALLPVPTDSGRGD